MPTIYRKAGFRYFFYSNEGNEPAHVHVEGHGGEMKVWLEPTIKTEFSYGLSNAKQRAIRKVVEENSILFREQWYGFVAQKI